VYLCGREAVIRGGELAAALRGKAVKVLAVVPDDQLAFRDLVEYAASSADVHGIREAESLGLKLDELTSSRLPSTEGSLLAHLSLQTAQDAWFLLGAAVLLGRNRVGATDLANAVGASDRTVRRRLVAAGIVTPGDFPACCTGAYLASDIQLRGITIDAAAHSREFEGTDHLRRYLVARTGGSPTAWTALGAEGAVIHAGHRIRMDGEKRAVGGEKPSVRGDNGYGTQVV